MRSGNFSQGLHFECRPDVDQADAVVGQTLLDILEREAVAVRANGHGEVDQDLAERLPHLEVQLLLQWQRNGN